MIGFFRKECTGLQESLPAMVVQQGCIKGFLGLERGSARFPFLGSPEDSGKVLGFSKACPDCLLFREKETGARALPIPAFVGIIRSGKVWSGRVLHGSVVCDGVLFGAGALVFQNGVLGLCTFSEGRSENNTNRSYGIVR